MWPISKDEKTFMKVMGARGIKLIQQPWLREFGIRPDFYSPSEDTYYEVTSSRQAYLAKARKVRKLNKVGLRVKFVNPDGSAYGPLAIKKVKTRGMGEDKNYMLIGIPANFWDSVKIKCVSEKTSIKDKILQLLGDWLEGDDSIITGDKL